METMNKCGGRGECRFCHQMHDNVAFHEAHECEENLLIPRRTPEKVKLPATGLEIHCNGCREPITAPAAILFSPPTEILYEKMMVKKFHICHACYGRIYDLLVLEGNSYDPQRTPPE